MNESFYEGRARVGSWSLHAVVLALSVLGENRGVQRRIEVVVHGRNISPVQRT